MIDRLGPRKVMSIGALALAVAMAGSRFATEIWHFYLLFGVLAAFGICTTGYVPNTILVSRWFVKRRGTALGIYGAGFAVAYVMVSGVELIIGEVGWRNAFVVLSLLAAGIAPVIAIFQRLDPREKGLLPDGETQSYTAESPEGLKAETLIIDKEWTKESWTLPKAMRTYRFWFLFLGNLLMWGVAVNLILAHQVAFAVDEGYSRAFGALVYSVYGLFYGAGNLMGFLSDRLGREVTVSIGQGLGILGILMLIINQGNETPLLMYGYSLLFGLGLGIISPAFTAAIADLFQGKHFGSIHGLIVMGFGLGGSASAWLGGKIFDEMGTYIPAFFIVMAALALTAACLWIAAPRQIRLVAGRAPRAVLKKATD